MYIGLISDTHGVFSDEFRTFLDPVDVVWHAGDFGGPVDFARTIRDYKPLVGVYGNCDGTDYRREFPLYQVLRFEGLKIVMTHIGGSPGHYYPSALSLIRAERPDVFICGHSHILKVQKDSVTLPGKDFLYINPGAAGLQGWHVVRTALRFKVEGGQLTDMEVFNLPRR